jgi:hypothetical protein
MKRVHQELDNQHLADDLEHAVNKGKEGAALDIFNDLYGLYTLGEFEYKKINQNRLMHNPAHTCSGYRCHLTPVEIMAYRLEHHDNWFTGERNISVHLCFPTMCPHIDPRHRCEDQLDGNCPHMHKYAPQDIRKLKDFWVCSDTGNVHICGERCDKSAIKDMREGDYVCSLTGQVTERHIVPVEYHVNQQLQLAAGNEDELTMDNGLAYALQKKGVRKLLASGGKALSVTVPLWERQGDIVLHHACVAAVCDQLFFSEDRQMMEANNYLSAYQRSYEEVVKSMRVRKMMDGVNRDMARFSARMLAAQGLVERRRVFKDEEKVYHNEIFTHLIKIPAVIAMYQFRSPTSTYFHNVPMLPDVAVYMRDRLNVINAKYAALFKLPVTETGDEVRERAVVKRRRDELLRQSVSEYRERIGAPPRRIVKWDSPEWQTRMKNIKDIFSHCLVRVWINIIKQNALSETGEGVNLSFKRCLLALLYMTRKTVSVSDEVYSDAITSAPVEGPMVTVIPRIEFAMLLPPENQLDRFNLMPYSTNAMSRKLTTTQTEIKNCIHSIGNKGHLSSMQLRMIDVYAEILEKKQSAVAAVAATAI